MEAGTEAAIRSMSPLRVAQAIEALAADGVIDDSITSPSRTWSSQKIAAISPADIDAEPAQVTATQAEMEAGTEAAIRSVSPLRVKQAIEANAQAPLVSGTNIKTVNSTPLLGSGNIVTGDVTLTGTQTLTNKTLTSPTITGAVLNDGYTEEVFVVTGTTPALSPTNGSIQTWTLSGASTPTAGTWAAGQSMTLMINDGTAFTTTWTSLGVVWAGGTAPTLATSGYTVIELWKVGSTIYGALVGEVA